MLRPGAPEQRAARLGVRLGVGRGGRCKPGNRGAGRGCGGAGAAGAAAETPRPVPCPPSGCLDMLSLQGQFSFTADRPQLHCAAFFISEPEEFITIYYDLVSIDCQGGDFLKVRRPHPAARHRRRAEGKWAGCCARRGEPSLGEPVTFLVRRSAGTGTASPTQDLAPHQEGLGLRGCNDLNSPLCTPGADASKDLNSRC